MTLPGGPADKLGNRYEKLWTISEIVSMLMGFAVCHVGERIVIEVSREC
jgi:hypothetical protein